MRSYFIGCHDLFRENGSVNPDYIPSNRVEALLFHKKIIDFYEHKKSKCISKIRGCCRICAICALSSLILTILNFSKGIDILLLSLITLSAAIFAAIRLTDWYNTHNEVVYKLHVARAERENLVSLFKVRLSPDLENQDNLYEIIKEPLKESALYDMVKEIAKEGYR